jgi:hypothetical protein
MSNRKAHDRSYPAAVLVGGARGRLKGNRHLAARKDEPTANLLLASGLHALCKAAERPG